MAPFPLHKSLKYRQYSARGLRHQAKRSVPFSVRNLIRARVVIVQYDKRILWKHNRDVVQDLAQVLPNIEALLYVWKLSNTPGKSSRFAVFLSDEDELPLATSLRGSHKTLAGALQATSASIRYRTDFACRPVEIEEILAVSDMMTGYLQPFEGASLVLERDREAINLYEAQYEAYVKAYRSAQASLVSGTPCEGTTAAADAEEPIVDEGKQLEENREGTDVEEAKRGNAYRLNDTKKECTTSGNKTRKRDEEEDEGQWSDNSSTNPTPSTSTSTERPSRQRRTNSQALDPITVEDRKQWINHIASEESEETGSDRHSSLLKDFLSTVSSSAYPVPATPLQYSKSTALLDWTNPSLDYSTMECLPQGTQTGNHPSSQQAQAWPFLTLTLFELASYAIAMFSIPMLYYVPVGMPGAAGGIPGPG